MSKTIEVDRIEYHPRTGVTAIRWEKLTEDGESLGFHRTTVSDIVDPVTGDVTPISVAQVIAAVDAHLGSMKYPPTSPDDAVLAHALREFGKTPTASLAKLMDAATHAVLAENKGLASDNLTLQALVAAPA